MSRELLPCPFCGGDANFKTTPESWGYHSGSVEVRCRKCGGSCGYQDDYSARKKAAAAWNTRAPVSVTNDPRVVELAEALRECVSDMELTEEYYGQHDGAQDALTRARAALANLEKKE